MSVKLYLRFLRRALNAAEDALWYELGLFAGERMFSNRIYEPLARLGRSRRS